MQLRNEDKLFAMNTGKNSGTSLLVQWLKIHLPMQGTQVGSLVQEDPTRSEAPKPVSRKYWAEAPQLLKPAHLRVHAPQQEKPAREAHAPKLKSSPYSPQLGKSICLNKDSAQPKGVNIKKKKRMYSLCSVLVGITLIVLMAKIFSLVNLFFIVRCTFSLTKLRNWN